MTPSCSSSQEQVIRDQPRLGDKNFMRCPWGLLRITRRIIRTPLGARQTSNAYRFSELGSGDRKPDSTNSTATTNLFKNKGMQPSLPGLVPLSWILNPRQNFASMESPLKNVRF
jgi:hypothetical protein